MKIAIKNRYNSKILFEEEAKNLKELVVKNKANLSGANLFGANLSEADLSGADLSGANLFGANLSGANLFKLKIKIIQKEDLIKSIGVVYDNK